MGEVEQEAKVIVAGMVNKIRPLITRKSNKEMAFVTLEDISGMIDLVVFPNSWEKFRNQVDIDNLLVSQPDTGEQALEIAEALVRSGAIDVIVVDSVAALVPRAEIEGEMGDTHVGLQARLMSQALRKLTGAISRSRTTVIFINQIREKVGVIYGSPEVTTGGRALKFYSSMRIEVRKQENIKQGTDIIGSRTRAKVVKNKVAPPFKHADFDIMYGTGISKEGSILDVAAEMDIINKSGSWYSYQENRIGQGRENVKEYLKEHPEITSEIEQKVRLALNMGGSKETSVSEIPVEDQEAK